MAADDDDAPLEDPEKQSQAKKSNAIGIDLGTTYSCVGIFRDGEVQIIANDQGNRTTPSYVAWTEEERLLGDAAKNQVSSNPTNTVFDAKRLIGRRFDDPIVQGDLKLWPFTVVSDKGAEDKPLIEVYYQGVKKQFHAEEVSSMVLTKMKQTAEAYLGTRVREAVITVPAYFNDSQRQATKDAGEIAGLNVLRIVNEPTAAAIAYGLDRLSEAGGKPAPAAARKAAKEETNILVFDMGGGTFDVSILNIDGSVFEVKATAGDPHLGGEDFDNRLLSYCIAEFRRKHKSDPSRNQRAIRRLRTQCERAKRQLSSQTQATIEVDSLHDGADFSLRISRAKFEELCIDFFKKAMDPVSQCLADSGLSKSMIKEIVMVGGSTRIPKVQQLISDFFNGKSLCKDINPDEAVAYGAAVQAAIVSGAGTAEVQNMLLLDVAPLSLGLEMAGGMMEKLIERNSTIPTNKSKDFTTADDYQEYVDINVYEGERAMVKDNNYLGRFTLKGLPRTLRGVPKIKVTFNIDSNGILTIEAVDNKNHLSGSIQIENEKGRLSQREIERMLKDAETYKDQDSLARDEIVARESLKGYISRLRKSIDDFDESKMARKEREMILTKLHEATKWLETTGERSTKKECEDKQKEVESAWNIIMIRINQALDDFWDKEMSLNGEKIVLVENGGFHLRTGFDLRELMEDPD
eukprot:CAMPEP_0198540996 /NCGR_PEP_ID=MMETSP1462-20131121/53508_1 /TAXON_ID=1333877 /ORGANISM="Brandtodinium nutriculum, Strain RCC3387" /LENGTH=689 /DNA_ID=CAMNT_0044271139 /DNA_START=59 /DNA_END=2128 /DNA_ORIENTATION=+